MKHDINQQSGLHTRARFNEEVGQERSRIKVDRNILSPGSSRRKKVKTARLVAGENSKKEAILYSIIKHCVRRYMAN